MNVTIPSGYRRVKNGEKIKEGDLYCTHENGSADFQNWELRRKAVGEIQEDDMFTTIRKRPEPAYYFLILKLTNKPRNDNIILCNTTTLLKCPRLIS